MRLVDPRRPLTSPTQAEKEEGLMQYNPFLPLIPHNAVTINGTVAQLRGTILFDALWNATNNKNTPNSTDNQYLLVLLYLRHTQV